MNPSTWIFLLTLLICDVVLFIYAFQDNSWGLLGVMAYILPIISLGFLIIGMSIASKSDRLILIGSPILLFIFLEILLIFLPVLLR